MRMLLLSGLGPESLYMAAVEGTLFEPGPQPELAGTYTRLAGRPVDLHAFRSRATGQPLLRTTPAFKVHLPTATLRSILDDAAVDYECFDLENVWQKTGAEPSGDFDIVGLSTTFIWNMATLQGALAWIRSRYPAATVVLGGQFSNLKFRHIFEECGQVDFIIRGDAESALPLFMRAMEGKADLSSVPNLTWRAEDGTVQAPPIEYIDLETHPSPSFRGPHTLVPYESMRGCPFDCKFCSFPLASPTWRYKSARKIVDDWARYRDVNGASVIKAMDSTFTVPPTRLRELMTLLPPLNLHWHAYARANAITGRDLVDQLEAAHCSYMFIGFESMSDESLKRMRKRVTAAQNRHAATAFAGSGIDLHASFMIGYLGETPEDFAETRAYLVDEFEGHFNLHYFMMQDETMPLWEDGPLYDLELENGWTWKHSGMDSKTAWTLRGEALREVRWKNDRAVQNYWQFWYDRPLLPGATHRQNLAVEKTLDRLAYVARDFGDGPDAARRCRGLLDSLESAGVDTGLDHGKPAVGHVGGDLAQA